MIFKKILLSLLFLTSWPCISLSTTNADVLLLGGLIRDPLPSLFPIFPPPKNLPLSFNFWNFDDTPRTYFISEEQTKDTLSNMAMSQIGTQRPSSLHSLFDEQGSITGAEFKRNFKGEYFFLILPLTGSNDLPEESNQLINMREPIAFGDILRIQNVFSEFKIHKEIPKSRLIVFTIPDSATIFLRNESFTINQLILIYNSKLQNISSIKEVIGDLLHNKLKEINLEKNLSTIDFTYADLSGVTLENAFLPNAYMYGANLTFADFSNSNFNGTNLTKSKLQHTKLNGSQMISASLSQANINYTQFNNSNLTQINFSNTVIGKDTEFKNSNLQYANFSNASIKAPDFTMSNLQHFEYLIEEVD